MDEWIGEQIIRLEETQRKLAMIESESSTLQTTYKNLASTQNIIESLLSILTFTVDEEKALKRPDQVLEFILSTTSLKNISNSPRLRFLLDTIDKLKVALNMKEQSFHGFSSEIIRQLQATNAIVRPAFNWNVICLM